MVKIKVYSYNRDKNVVVDVENVPDKSYQGIKTVSI